MSAERSPEFRNEARRVLRWCAVYTRGLDPGVAAARQDEIASDLHEHAAWAADHDIRATRLARSIRRRAIVGAISDIAWRRQQLRVEAPSIRRGLRVDAMLLTMVFVTGMALATTGAFAVARVVRALTIGDIGVAPTATFSLIALAAVALAGSMLLLWRRTRIGASLLLMVPALFTLQLAGGVLWQVSASTVVAFHYAPWWSTAAQIAGIGLAVLCLAAAAYWWSEDRGAVATRQRRTARV